MSNGREKIKAQLRDESLWRLFHSHQTEMIITRSGRRMFPILDFRLSGLEPDEYFSCTVQIISLDDFRYRYDLNKATWVATGAALKLDQRRVINSHPHGATLGKIWNSEGAKFDKLKLTNHIKPCCDHIVLASLQKYKVQLVITRLHATQCERLLFDFPETEFMAVTCYQNPEVVRLKINHNPFAKSFRQGKR
ncbi:predicted protein [Nematostella vectensis]|uniref:T-box domain-containing protein n=2 Tax=Nematostella vectensis TaxID=45351 RepID=A7SNF4_NEMVE|nr:predicted protein [Nematostella vectensis]|eukprot:XP_001626870.1 predicted protein [Nematostella vectensis]